MIKPAIPNPFHFTVKFTDGMTGRLVDLHFHKPGPMKRAMTGVGSWDSKI